MPFELGSGEEELLLKGVRDFCNANGLKAIISGENQTPKTNVVVSNAREMRDSTRTVCDNKSTRWRFWQVQVEVPHDELAGGKRTVTHTPDHAEAVKSLGNLFDPNDETFRDARNIYGIYGARLRKDNTNIQVGKASRIDRYTLECQTLAFAE